MMMLNVDDLIEFCNTERLMLHAHNGGNSVACTALCRVIEFAKEYAVEVENKSIGWVDDESLPNEDMIPDNELIIGW